MLRKIVCLFILMLGLALVAGCAAKSHFAAPEDVLKEIASSRWEIDIDASMKVDSAARDEINKIGRENFIQEHGQFGFGINLQTRKYEVYTSREVLAQSEPFVVDPETPESKAAWESGIGEVSFRSGENRTEIFTLRYEDNGKVSFFKNDKLGGVFSRLKE